MPHFLTMGPGEAIRCTSAARQDLELGQGLLKGNCIAQRRVMKVSNVRGKISGDR
jgi:hypothetical protein